MTDKSAGHAWLLLDDINTDQLAPGRYMKAAIDVMAAHCLENVMPEFSATVEPGDIVIAGRNFGIGSSREQAVQTLQYLGISLVLALSFGSIFYRNAINLGLPAMTIVSSGELQNRERVEYDLASGRVYRPGAGCILQCQSLPHHLSSILRDGGLIAHLKKRLGS